MRRVKSFDFDALSERERYKLLIGTVVPRPIALVTTLGRYDGTIGPGFNVTMPWPLQSVDRREVGKETVTALPDKDAETLMLTADGELVNLAFQVRWRVSDLRAFTYNLPDGEAARRKYLATEPAYFRYLGRLAGKEFLPLDKDAMLAFLRTRAY